MPIWDDPDLPVAKSITQRVRDGNALPILSHSALFDLVLFGHERFRRFYLDCLKNHIFREAETAGVDKETLEEARSQADHQVCRLQPGWTADRLRRGWRYSTHLGQPK